MTTSIFVNLPVADLERSKPFFAELGYRFNPQFTDDKAACMVISDTIYAMLLKQDFFGTFLDKPVVDAKQSSEVLVALSFESRDAVSDTCEKAFVLRRPQVPRKQTTSGSCSAGGSRTSTATSGSASGWTRLISRHRPRADASLRSRRATPPALRQSRAPASSLTDTIVGVEQDSA